MPIYNGSKRIGVLSLGGKEIGKAYLGGVCVFNKEVVYEYDDPIVELTYPTISNTGGEYKPSYSYTQTASGSDGSVIKITSGGSLSWSIVNKASDVNFDSTTGEMACSVNSTDSDRLLGRVTLTVSLNGKTGSASYAIYQSAKEVVTEEYSTPSVSLSYGTASATATSLSPSYSYRQTKTTTYSDGSTATSTITSGGSLSWSVSNRYSGATFSSSTGAFSFSANSTTSQITLGTVTLTVTLNGKSGSASATAYQAAGTITYSTPSVSLSYTIAAAGAGATATPTCTYSQTRYVNGVADSTQITSGGSLSYSASDVYDDLMSYNSSTGVVTTGQANSSTSRKLVCTMTVTVTLNGMTGTATASVYQLADITAFVAPVVTIDETIFQEAVGSGTMRIYFNISVILNDANAVFPDYFLGPDGTKHIVYQESVHHETTTSGGADTAYYVDVQYNGNSAFSSSYLYSTYEVYSSDGDSFDGEVASTNLLVNNSGDFYVRS